MGSEYLAKAEELIKAEVRMISGCRDEQTSADVSNVQSFSLPNPAGRSGGACTSAMLQILYKDHTAPDAQLSFQDVLLEMREVLRGDGYSQIPQLSSSRPLDINHVFNVVPDNFSGTRRAVMIGINYVGQQGQLSGCHNDVNNMIEYLKDVHSFEEENMTILIDDGQHMEPTHDNILSAYKHLVANAKPGDALFCHYSGHGGKLKDTNNDESDGYDETLVPVDYDRSGQIRDDDIFETLIAPLPAGVTLTCVMDCCHSGTVLDLPYVFVADGTQDEMGIPENFDFGPMISMFKQYMASHGHANVAKLPIEEAVNACCALLSIL